MDKLIVDIGDFAGGSGKYNSLKAEFLLKTMKALNYQAINIGERDLLLGIDFLLEQQNSLNIPFISTNLRYKSTNQYFVKPFQKIDLFKSNNQLNIIILGIIDPIIFSESFKAHEKLYAEEPVIAIRSILAKYKKEYNFVVLLSHAGYNKSRKIATQIPELDVIISGHDYSVRINPIIIGKTRLVQGRNKGQALNNLHVYINKSAENSTTNTKGQYGHSKTLDNSFHEASEILKIISQYLKQKNIQFFEKN